MDELIADFLTETKESLEEIDTQLVTLEQNPNDKKLLGSIFRIMHTIKGTCGFLGLSRLEKVAHAGENIMDKIRSGDIPASSNNISMILEAIDRIKEMVDFLEANGQEDENINDNDLVERLNKAANSENGGTKDKKEPTKDDQDAKNDIESDNKQDNKVKIDDKNDAIEQDSNEEKIEQKQVENNAPPINKTVETIVQQSVRVSVDVLENLMQVVSELVLNRNQLLQINRQVKDNQFRTPIQRLNHITSDLQEGVMQTRMQPIKNAWTKFPRLIRDLSKDLNKKIELKMVGEDTELDRQLIEAIKDPLTHMVRNAADHGLEGPEERVKAGKGEKGTITLEAYHQGGHIIIEVSDDGRGVNIDKIKEKIRSSNLATEAELEKLRNQQIIQYIFKPGFSTAEKISSVSGRGVGMDVVKSNIEKISGTVELKSDQGKGSRFVIKIPLTLAIMPILIIETGGERFGIPQINILEMLKISDSSGHKMEKLNGKKVIRLRGDLLPLLELSDVLQIENKLYKEDNTKQEEKGNNKKNKKHSFVVVCEVSGQHYGIIVNKIYDTEEVVVKSVVPILQQARVYSGNTILGDGKVILILDPIGLMKHIGQLSIAGHQESDADNKNDDLIDDGIIGVHKGSTSTFLVLQVDDEHSKCIPLEVVSRLEEINVKNIELSGGKRVVQYRGGFMYLSELSPDFVYPKEGVVEVVVFSNAGKMLGLVVKKIFDIVEQDLEASHSLEDSGFHATVLGGQTFEIIDVNYYFELIFKGHKIEDEQIIDDAKREANKGKRILFIDDSPFFRKFIPPTIKKAGYSIITVESAVKAIKLLEKDNKFDLIITDINMPHMTGIDFAAYCKKDEALKDIPIIALTSNNNDDAKSKEMLDRGIIDCISKINPEDMLFVIEDAINQT